MLSVCVCSSGFLQLRGQMLEDFYRKRNWCRPYRRMTPAPCQDAIRRMTPASAVIFGRRSSPLDISSSCRELIYLEHVIATNHGSVG
jgi:hypothetical protein